MDAQEAIDNRIQYPYNTEVNDRGVPLCRLRDEECCYNERQPNVAAEDVDREEHRREAPQVRRRGFCGRTAAQPSGSLRDMH